MTKSEIDERFRGIFEMASPPHLAAMTALVLEVQGQKTQDAQDAKHYRYMVDVAQASGFESLSAAIVEAVNSKRRRV